MHFCSSLGYPKVRKNSCQIVKWKSGKLHIKYFPLLLGRNLKQFGITSWPTLVHWALTSIDLITKANQGRPFYLQICGKKMYHPAPGVHPTN